MIRPSSGPRLPGLLAPSVIALAFMAASLPTLHWLPFYNSIENIVVETALETRRGGHWLVPRMLDEPRTRKPPLAAWLSAAAASPETVEQLSDPKRREASYLRLARDVRLPALCAACLTILATCELGRLLGGSSAAVGPAAGVVAATSLLFLDYARLATADTYLALGVTTCNVCLAHAVFRGRRWAGCCGAGACLALAMMSKGPVALVHTVAPALIAAAVIGWQRDGSGHAFAPAESRRAGWTAQIVAGLVLMFCLALPWPLAVSREVPGVWRVWLGEVTRVDAADPRPERWYAASEVFRHFLPWTVWLVPGVLGAGLLAWRRSREPIVLAFWLFVVPVVVLSCFGERKPRYLLPVIPAGAVLAGWALVHVLRDPGQRAWRRWAFVAGHGVLAAALVVGTILAGLRLHGAAAMPWVTPRVVVLGAIATIGVTLLGVLVAGGRRRPAALLASTAAAMLLYDVARAGGVTRGDARRSDMKPLADVIAARAAPEARVVSVCLESPERNAPLDLSIYLNRVVRPVGSVKAAVSAAGPGGVIVVGAGGGGPPPPEQVIAQATILGAAPRGSVVWRAYFVARPQPDAPR